MIPANAFRSARPADVHGGNLVALKWDGRFLFGIAISSHSGPPPQPQQPPSAPQRGILLLRSDEGGPIAVSLNGYCLDLGTPIFQWEHAGNTLSDATKQLPPRGHLIAHTDGLLITGVGVRYMQQGNCTWKIADGMMSEVDLAATIHMSRWSVGLHDATGQFQALFTFNPTAQP